MGRSAALSAGKLSQGVVRILSVLSKLIGFSIDSSALQSWVSEFEGVLQQQVAKNDELRAFIKQLETAYDQTMTDTDVQQGDENRRGDPAISPPAPSSRRYPTVLRCAIINWRTAAPFPLPLGEGSQMRGRGQGRAPAWK